MRSSGSKSIKVTDDHLNSTIVFVYPTNFKMNSSKVGFGYCGFDSSITAVIPKHEIIRPTEVHRIKKIHPHNWNSSPKIPTGKAAVIKPLPGTKKTLDELKPNAFRAKPVPRSHYNEPYRPEVPSKKDRQPKIAAIKVAYPGSVPD